MSTATIDPSEVIIERDLPPRERASGRFVKIKKEKKAPKTIEELLNSPMPEIDTEAIFEKLRAKGLPV